MTSTLIYSFRTNKHLDRLKQEGIEVFIFGKLKDDLISFQNLINKQKPKYIIGIAEVKTQSRFESITINRFGKKGKVNKIGRDSYDMYIPVDTDFILSIQSSNSFCNWTMYKISEIIYQKNIKNSFIHFNQKDLFVIINLLKSFK
jgi:hypothetical protein